MDLVTLWNLALSEVGSRALISAPDERGREADLCRLHYPHVRDVLLKGASWPCASAWQALAVLEERNFSAAWTVDDPAPGWRFTYAAPSDMLAPRYLASFGRFTAAAKAGQAVIYCSEEDAILHYTAAVTDVSLFDHGLVNAIVAALAARLCRPITGKDGRTADLRQAAVEAVLLARTEFANESDEHVEALPSWLQARGLSMTPQSSRFYYPISDVNKGSI